MKITVSHLRKIIKEEVAIVSEVVAQIPNVASWAVGVKKSKVKQAKVDKLVAQCQKFAQEHNLKCYIGNKNPHHEKGTRDDIVTVSEGKGGRFWAAYYNKVSDDIWVNFMDPEGVAGNDPLAGGTSLEDIFPDERDFVEFEESGESDDFMVDFDFDNDTNTQVWMSRELKNKFYSLMNSNEYSSVGIAFPYNQKSKFVKEIERLRKQGFKLFAKINDPHADANEAVLVKKWD